MPLATKNNSNYCNGGRVELHAYSGEWKKCEVTYYPNDWDRLQTYESCYVFKSPAHQPCTMVTAPPIVNINLWSATWMNTTLYALNYFTLVAKYFIFCFCRFQENVCLCDFWQFSGFLKSNKIDILKQIALEQRTRRLQQKLKYFINFPPLLLNFSFFLSFSLSFSGWLSYFSWHFFKFI